MAATLLLSVSEGLIRYGDKTLFDGLGFSIREGEKTCLIGKNGAGKTTLMNIITGARELDEGTRWQLQGATIGYLQQEITPRPGETVRDFIFAALNNQDGSHDYKIERVVEPLQIHLEDQLTKLSGGQMRRAALARALVEEPDILLLDEPTNHLDLDVIEWLETYLKEYRGAILCISHDKAFLSNVSQQVYWLDRGKLKICPRGFSYFEEWSQMLLEQESRELHNRQKNLDIEVEWASRGVKARRKRNVRRVELMKEERARLRADKNALKRMLARIEFEADEPVEANSKIAAEFYNVYKSYTEDERSKLILEKFNLRILRGDRIGVIGKNGSGKTTFLRLLTGELKADAGKVKLAHDLQFSYFDQKRKDLIPENSIQRTLCPNGSDHIDVMGTTRHVYGYLKDFLFDPKMAQHPVSVLSGGQKNRLMLAKIMANPGGLLILDEPTNDLDMETLDMLEDMLATYKGTLIVVSHDRDFLDQTVSKILAFEGEGRVEAVIGGYQDYLARHKPKPQEAEIAKPSTKNKKGAPAPLAPKVVAKMTYIQTYELQNLPGLIEKLEKEIVKLEPQLADPELYTSDPGLFNKLSRDLAHARADLDRSEERWLELEALRLTIEAT